jgi:hypothetical protein
MASSSGAQNDPALQQEQHPELPESQPSASKGSQDKSSGDSNIDIEYLSAHPTGVQNEILDNLERHVDRDEDPAASTDTKDRTIDQEVLRSIPTKLGLETMTSTLPEGWTAKEWQGNCYYVNYKRRIKTWKKPESGDFPTTFRKRTDVQDCFTADRPPPLPTSFIVAVEDESEQPKVDRDFQTPYEVYLVHAPVSQIQYIYDIVLRIVKLPLKLVPRSKIAKYVLMGLYSLNLLHWYVLLHILSYLLRVCSNDKLYPLILDRTLTFHHRSARGHMSLRFATRGRPRHH